MEIKVGQEIKIGFKTTHIGRAPTVKKKEALVTKIIRQDGFTLITVETDGFMPHVFTPADLRKAMELFDPQLFREELDSTDI